MKANLNSTPSDDTDLVIIVADESIYPVLAKHQREERWPRQHQLAFFQMWAGIYNTEFKLGIPFISLRVDKLPSKCYGHFRVGHNGFGLRGEIAINSIYLPPKRQVWEVLGTLLHDHIHAWQQEYGTPPRGNLHAHNFEFRQKALECGLIVDKDGVTTYAENGCFKDLLRCRGIEVPAGEFNARTTRPPTKSKLVKWSCSCTPPVNVRVAIADFQAMCLKCGARFVRQGDAVRPASTELMPVGELPHTLLVLTADNGGDP